MTEPSRKWSNELRWTAIILLGGLGIGGAWRYVANRQPLPVPLDLAKSSKPAHALNLQGAIKRGYVEKFEWHGDVLWMLATPKYLALDNDRELQQAIALNALAVAKADNPKCKGVLIVDAAGKAVGELVSKPSNP